MSRPALKLLVEAALLASEEPLSMDRLMAMFEADGEPPPGRQALREALVELAADCEHRAVELKEVASGFRLQVKSTCAPWVNRLWSERPARYSRALLETLAIIAYRQPVTRGEIEDIRGVAVSTGIIRTLMEREWVKVAGHRDVPGRPAVYVTTRQFLDYFNLRSMAELPPLSDLRDFEELSPDLFQSAGAKAPDGASTAEGAADGGDAPGADAGPQDAAGSRGSTAGLAGADADAEGAADAGTQPDGGVAGSGAETAGPAGADADAEGAAGADTPPDDGMSHADADRPGAGAHTHDPGATGTDSAPGTAGAGMHGEETAGEGPHPGGIKSVADVEHESASGGEAVGQPPGAASEAGQAVPDAPAEQPRRPDTGPSTPGPAAPGPESLDEDTGT